MAIGDSYITLDEFRSYLDLISGDADVHDAEMQNAIDAASRAINRKTHRQFNNVTVATERKFEPLDPWRVYVDDFYSTAGLELSVDLTGTGDFSELWSASDYELTPDPDEGGIVDGMPGFPCTRIDSLGVKRLRWPALVNGRSRTVKVKALWGWESVPDDVRQACFIHAADIYNLKDSKFGVQIGLGDFGYARIRDNSQVANLLRTYVRSGSTYAGTGD